MRLAADRAHDLRRVALAGRRRQRIGDRPQLVRASAPPRAPRGSPRGRTAASVPGIGTMSSPWASTHASASCAGVHALLARPAPRPRATSVEVLREVLALEARRRAAVVVRRRDRRRDLNRAGEEAAAERRVRRRSRCRARAGRQDLVLGVARPQRVLGLQRGDRVDRLARRIVSGPASESPR